VTAPIEILRALPGFDTLADEELRNVLGAMRQQRLPAGMLLFRKGDPGSTMVLVLEGTLTVHVVPKDGPPVEYPMGPGSVLGEFALLAGVPRTADVSAETEAVVLIGERQVIHDLIARHPQMARFLTELLGRRLDDGGLSQIGKYVLFQKLGQGTSGRVYAALHPTLGRPVAIKMLSHQLVWQPEVREQFQAEARILASLDHPHIVGVFDIIEAYATLFLVMERVDGLDLRKVLKRSGSLGVDRSLDVLRQLASGLRHAHERGIVHRDIKPANVAVTMAGQVKLMDFGLATTVDSTEAGTGTPHYVAPEVVRGEPIDHRADIYALGIMAFELVTGRRPFKSGTLPQVLAAHVLVEPLRLEVYAPLAPAGLVEFVHRALEKDPNERISDWDRIEELLGATDASAARGRTAKITWSAEADAQVRATLHALRRIDGVDVQEGAHPSTDAASTWIQDVLRPDEL